MARFGIWRPLAENWHSQPRLTSPSIICLHTMVGSLWGTDSYFRQNGYGGTESHFGVGGDGTCLQWQDTRFQADANYLGNGEIISIETADMDPVFPRWGGSDVPAWTEAQLDTLARLVAFLCREHDIPCTLVPDSKRGRRGIAYHRQGADPYRVAGGVKWSTAYGKVCPGDRRVAQIPEVIRRARLILEGDEDSMPLTEDDKRGIWNVDAGGEPGKQPAWALLSQARTAARTAHENTATLLRHAMAQEQKIAGLTAAVTKLADALGHASPQVDAEDLRSVIREEMERVVQVEVSVRDVPKVPAPEAPEPAA